MTRLLPVLVLSIGIPASSLPGQDLGVFTGLFKNIHSVDLYVQGGDLGSTGEIRGGGSEWCSLDICGAGIEMLIALNSPTKHTHVALALGASYQRGFQSARSDLDLHGSIRSFPIVSAYVSRTSLWSITAVRPYVGLSFGIADLWNAQAYDTLRQRYAVRGQTFEFGATVGMEFHSPILRGLFIEAGYRWRRFGSIDWDFPASADEVLPEGWPREMNLSGAEVAIGLNFYLSPEDVPPALDGMWHLASLDDQKLPATFSQRMLGPTDVPGSGSERDDVVDGSLRIDSTAARYSLVLYHRTTRLDSGARQVSVGHLVARQDSGSLSRSARGDFVLRSDGPLDPSGPFAIARKEDTISVRLPDTNHALTFTKVK